jgi:hypothetical protein
MIIMYLQKVIGRKTKIFEKIGSGSIGQRHGSADPDPYQNATDPQHWFTGPNMITTLHTAVAARIRSLPTSEAVSRPWTTHTMWLN